MKLGLGLSLPGVAAMGGKQAYRVYAEAAFRLDARFNPDQTTGVPTDLSVNRLTVTVGGSPTWTPGQHWEFNGSNQWFEVADDALLDMGPTDSITGIVVFDVASTVNGVLMAKKTSGAAATVGWSLVHIGSATGWTQITDGTNDLVQTPSVAVSTGVRTMRAFVRNVATDQLTIYHNGTATSSTDSTTGTMANGEALRIGRYSGAGTTYLPGRVYGALLVRRALSAGELAAIRADWGIA